MTAIRPETAPEKPSQPSQPAPIKFPLQMGFNWERFHKDTNTLEKRCPLLKELKRNHMRAHDFASTYSTFCDLEIETERMMVETNNINGDLAALATTLQNVVQRQQTHNTNVFRLQERLKAAAKAQIQSIPRQVLLDNVNHWFYNQEQQRAVNILLHFPGATKKAQQTAQALTTPSPEPSSIQENPLWRTQSPYFRDGKWYSIDQRRPKYREYNCDKCHLYGHIKYDCPHYKCPTCHKHCGQKPDVCLKTGPVTNPIIGRAYIDDHLGIASFEDVYSTASKSGATRKQLMKVCDDYLEPYSPTLCPPPPLTNEVRTIEQPPNRRNTRRRRRPQNTTPHMHRNPPPYENRPRNQRRSMTRTRQTSAGITQLRINMHPASPDNYYVDDEYNGQYDDFDFDDPYAAEH